MNYEISIIFSNNQFCNLLFSQLFAKIQIDRVNYVLLTEIHYLSNTKEHYFKNLFTNYYSKKISSPSSSFNITIANNYCVSGSKSHNTGMLHTRSTKRETFERK